MEGTARQWVRTADSGQNVTFSFCPTCGTTLFWVLEALPGSVAVALGGFAGHDTAPLAPPTVSIYEARQYDWLAITGEVEHLD